MNGTTLDSPYPSTNGHGNGSAHPHSLHDTSTTPPPPSSTPNPSNQNSNSTPFDPQIFKSYLLALLPPVLGAAPDELESLWEDREEFEERVLRFVSDTSGSSGGGGGGGQGGGGGGQGGGGGGAAIYVVKRREGEGEGTSNSTIPQYKLSIDGLIYLLEWADDPNPPPPTYHLTPHLTYTSNTLTTLALIKRSPHTPLDPLSPLATQLHILNLFWGEETPYESLHAVVRDGVKPWFDAFVGARGGGKDGVGKMGEPSFTSPVLLTLMEGES